MTFSKMAAAVAAIVLGSVSGFSMANDGRSGVIEFSGSIHDAPCSIVAGESGSQSFQLQPISARDLKDGGKSAPQAFSIKLSGCDLESLKSATATFDGPNSITDGLLALKGSASGASLAIANQQGVLIKLGTASDAQALANGSSELRFTAYLQGDMQPVKGEDPAKPAEIGVGDFDATASFKLAYQ